MSENKFELSLVKGGKDKDFPKAEIFNRRVIEKSKIEEIRVFSRGEILGLLQQIINKGEMKMKDVELVEEYYDQEGNLIALWARVLESAAKIEGWRGIEYWYIIKGRHEIGISSESSIMKIYDLEGIDGQEDYVGSQGGIAAEFKDGKWNIIPLNILPKVEYRPKDKE